MTLDGAAAHLALGYKAVERVVCVRKALQNGLPQRGSKENYRLQDVDPTITRLKRK